MAATAKKAKSKATSKAKPTAMKAAKPKATSKAKAVAMPPRPVFNLRQIVENRKKEMMLIIKKRADEAASAKKKAAEAASASGPAANAEKEILKKPAAGKAANKRGQSEAWKTWSPPKKNDTEENAEEDSEGDGSDDDFMKDSSSQTKAQRHVFSRALDGLPGEPGALPQHAKDKFNNLKSKKARNQFVNSVLAKNCKYSDRVQWTGALEAKFVQRWTTHTVTDKACGETMTEIALRGGSATWRKRKPL